MGTSKWSNEFYESRATDRKARGLDLYAYHTSTSSQAQSERKVHAQMNPYGVTRESRDSDEHPESIAIGVILDQTGSMKDTPREIQKVLPKLMTALVAGGVKDPPSPFWSGRGHDQSRGCQLSDRTIRKRPRDGRRPWSDVHGRLRRGLL